MNYCKVITIIIKAYNIAEHRRLTVTKFYHIKFNILQSVIFFFQKKNYFYSVI